MGNTNTRLNRRRAVAIGGGALMGMGLARASAATGTPAAHTGSPVPVLARGILPDYRILLYYGFPGNPDMGILGSDTPKNVLAKLKAEARNYIDADDSRPWKLGFEVIASVAERLPGADGMYVTPTDANVLDAYTRFTADNDLVLFLDVQMGRKAPADDYVRLEPWLAHDHVHLGIDPEFHVAAGEVPGVDYGHIDAQDVTDAQNWLVDLAKKHDTTRKVLVVHQFRADTIAGKETISPVDNVDLVIDEDGWGPPEWKSESYEVVIAQEPIEYNGIKLFYEQDDPLMTAAQTLAFDPEPDVVIYH